MCFTMHHTMKMYGGVFVKMHDYIQNKKIMHGHMNDIQTR